MVGPRGMQILTSSANTLQKKCGDDLNTVVGINAVMRLSSQHYLVLHNIVWKLQHWLQLKREIQKKKKKNCLCLDDAVKSSSDLEMLGALTVSASISMALCMK